MPQIILKERTAHLASYTFFTRDVDQYKNTSLSQLYQPPRTAFSQNTYHWLLSSCEYCKVFKNRLFYRTPSEAVICRYSSKQLFLKVLQTSQESTCVRVSFKKTCTLKACNFIKKRLYLFLITPFFYITPPVTASAPQVTASVFS